MNRSDPPRLSDPMGDEGDELRELLAAADPPRDMTARDHLRLQPRLDAVIASPPLGKWLWVKFGGVVVGVAAAVLVAREQSRSPRPQPEPITSVPPPSMHAPSAPSTAPRSPVTATDATSSSVPTALPTTLASNRPPPTVPVAVARPAPPTVSRPVDADTLVRESALLEQARSAARSDPRRAVALLREYDRRFARGALRDERTLIEVDALFRSGAPSAARALAQRLLRAYPHSLVAERTRALLREHED